LNLLHMLLLFATAVMDLILGEQDRTAIKCHHVLRTIWPSVIVKITSPIAPFLWSMEHHTATVAPTHCATGQHAQQYWGAIPLPTQILFATGMDFVTAEQTSAIVTWALAGWTAASIIATRAQLHKIANRCLGLQCVCANMGGKIRETRSAPRTSNVTDSHAHWTTPTVTPQTSMWTRCPHVYVTKDGGAIHVPMIYLTRV
jgi:hypothetical protein